MLESRLSLVLVQLSVLMLDPMFGSVDGCRVGVAPSDGVDEVPDSEVAMESVRERVSDLAGSCEVKGDFWVFWGVGDCEMVSG